jgi:hypothetical protein
LIFIPITYDHFKIISDYIDFIGYDEGYYYYFYYNDRSTNFIFASFYLSNFSLRDYSTINSKRIICWEFLSTLLCIKVSSKARDSGFSP